MPVKRITGPGAKLLNTVLTTLNKTVAKVGWFASAHYPNGTPVAEVAAIQEYGDPPKHIPARSYMRTTMQEKKSEWRKVASDGAKAALQGSISPQNLMETIGLKAAGDIRKKITTIQTPKLSEGTIRGRARRTAAYQNLKTGKSRRQFIENAKTNPTFTKPLVESKLLLNTLTNIVETK